MVCSWKEIYQKRVIRAKRRLDPSDIQVKLFDEQKMMLYIKKIYKRLISPQVRDIMKPSFALEQHRKEIRQAVKIRRACNARVFGSVIFGTDSEGSDLDILVDTLPGTTLFELGGLQVDLEELLGVPVDLLTPGELPPTFRDKVLSEAQTI